MEEMNARVMENEVMDETVEVDEAVDSGNAGALVAGIVGGFLAYAVIGCLLYTSPSPRDTR